MRKRNAIVLIVGIAFAVLGVIGLLVGYWLAGADIIGWFTSDWAIMFYFVVGIDLAVVIGIVIKDWIRKA